MPTQIIPISDTQLIFTGLLLLITAGISALFRLGLLKSLLWGTTRCFLQLSVVGYALAWIFSVNRFEIVILVIALMSLFAAKTATRRTPNVSDFPTLSGVRRSGVDDLSRYLDCITNYHPTESMVRIQDSCANLRNDIGKRSERNHSLYR